MSLSQSPLPEPPLSSEEMRAFFARPTDLMQTYLVDQKKHRETISKLNQSEQEFQKLIHTKEREKLAEIETYTFQYTHLKPAYQAFFSAYAKSVEEAYEALRVQAQRSVVDECEALRKEMDEKFNNAKRSASLSESLQAECEKKLQQKERVSEKIDHIQSSLNKYDDQRAQFLKTFNQEMERFQKKHRWYGKRIEVVTQGKGDKRKTWFDIQEKITGFERKLVNFYGKLFASKDRERLMAEAMKLHTALSKCDRQRVALEAAEKQLKDLTDAFNQITSECKRIQNKCQQILNETKAITPKLNHLIELRENLKTLSTDLVRQDTDGRLRLTDKQLKELLIKVPHAKDYPLVKQALTQKPFLNIYLERDAWESWINRQMSDQEKLLSATIQQKDKELDDFRALQQRALQKLIDQRERYTTQWKEAQKNYRETFAQWKADFNAIQDPALMPVWDNPEFSEKTAREACRQIAVRAAGRTIMPVLPIGYRQIETIEGSIKITKWIDWQKPTDNERFNFLIEYAKEEQPQALDTLNNLLLHMICAFPAKKLKFTFIDLNVTNQASLFTINLDAQLYHNNPLVKEQDLRKRLEELQDRMVTVSKQCSNLLRYNEENHTILFPYEVIVLLDYPHNLSPQIIQQMIPLCVHGHNGGIFFVVMREKTEEQPSASGSMPDLTNTDSFRRISLRTRQSQEGTNHYLPLASTSLLREACFAYLNTEAQKEEQTRIIEQPMESLYQAPYADAAEEFKVAVGENNGRTNWFRFDEASHAHAFVLGQSGSGKSVFLHNVINNALLQYAPDSLQLYLLDFKLGGVEFNRYRDAKQVRALLVDNSDPQITLEILRELYETMRQRGERLRNAGVSSLHDYNASHPETRLPRIILAVDECHELFRDRMDKTQTEINAIVTKIAKEGRSQGVHLLFATQTLANANIPSELLNNISDYYLLKCAQNDAEKLVRDSSKQTALLTTGWLLYAHEDKRELFQAYFADRERLEENLRQILTKSASIPVEDRFFFSGKQCFPFDDTVRQAIVHKSRRHPIGLMGRSIEVQQSPVGFPLKAGLGENALFFGLNTQEQTLRVVLDTLISLMVSYHHLGRPCRFYVLNCLNLQEEGPAESLLYALESYGCTMVEGADRGKLLASLAEEVRQHTAQESVVVILGQERFREVRLEMPLPAPNAPTPTEPQSPLTSHLGGLGALRPREEKRTYKSELRYLLGNGAEQHIHFLWQVDKPANLLFETVLSQQVVFSIFKHIVMLKSASDAALKLRLSDDIKLETLSEESERLRAYYYNDEEGTYTLFTPYVLPNANDLETLLK